MQYLIIMTLILFVGCSAGHAPAIEQELSSIKETLLNTLDCKLSLSGMGENAQVFVLKRCQSEARYLDLKTDSYSCKGDAYQSSNLKNIKIIIKSIDSVAKLAHLEFSNLLTNEALGHLRLEVNLDRKNRVSGCNVFLNTQKAVLKMKLESYTGAKAL